jgi:phage shock protein A
MHLWGRIGNLWKGFVSLWVADVEKNSPEIAYENAVQSMTDKYVALKKATAAILRRREELEARLAQEEGELAQLNADLNAAIDTNQDDLGVILVQKKKAVEAALDEIKASLQQAIGDADEAKGSLMNVKSEIDKLRAEKDRMLAKLHSAQARLKIQNQLEGLSVDAEVKALDNVRTHIKDVVAEAKLNQELKTDDLDNRLAALRQNAGNTAAKSELEALKAARAQQAVKKSM